MTRSSSTASPYQFLRNRPVLRTAGWVLASTFSVVVAASLGCGTASARPATEVSSEADSSPTNSQREESPHRQPDRLHLRDTKPTTSPSGGASQVSGDDDEVRAGSEPGSHGRRLSSDFGTGTSHRGNTAKAAITTVKDDPVGQTSPATTGQPQDAVSVPTKLAGDDEEPSGKLDAKVADRISDPEQATINTAGATEPVEPAGALAITTSSTPSPSTPSTITDQSSSVVELTVTPAATSALESLVDIAQREGHVNPLVAAATGAAAEVEAAPPAEYTGQPSFIHEVVVLVLRVVNAVLTPIGGILAFTGLKVPVFADGVPPFFVTTGLNVQRDSIAGMPVYILTPPAPTGCNCNCPARRRLCG